MGFETIKNTVEAKANTLVEAGINEAADAVTNAVNSVVSVGEGLLGDAASLLDGTESSGEDATPGPMSNSGVFPGQLVPGTTPPPWPNELQAFATVNHIFTLGVLTPAEVNDPLVFREAGGASINILRSGGGITKPQTEVEAALGITTEYFIDDVEIQSTIMADATTKGTNANQISFKVTEPYSMGMFLETLKVAAQQAGYPNHIEAVYLLTVDFIGYDQNNNIGTPGYSRRMLPLILTNVTFDVDAGGTQYNVEAIPHNDIGLGDKIVELPTDMTITGRNVAEILQSGLQSLATELNTHLLQKEATGDVVMADQVVFVFPKPDRTQENIGLGGGDGADAATVAAAPGGLQQDDYLYASVKGGVNETEGEDLEIPEEFETFKNGKTGKIQGRSKLGETIRTYSEDPENINDIGKEIIVEEFVEGGEHPFGKDGFAYDAEKNIYSRGNVELQLSDDIRTFKFKAGTGIVEVIEEIILISTFGKTVYDQLLNLPGDGMIKYYKVEPQVYIVPNAANVKKTGKTPKVFVYRIVEYKVHHSVIKAPSSASNVASVKAQCAKQYNYIYTGKNSEILEFDINFNFAYNMPIADNPTSKERGKTEKSSTTRTTEDIPTPAGSDGGDQQPAEGATPTEPQKKSDSGNVGGGGEDKTTTSIARSFNDALLKSQVNLAELDIKVMGDPFYLSDSGMGNFTAGDTSYTNMNRAGTMNHQNGEVHVNVIFRTPVDLDDRGSDLMLFPEDTKIIRQFSGIYRVNKADHMFSGNQYTTTLNLNRMLGQEEGEVQSFYKQGDPSNTTLADVPGGIFDEGRNVVENITDEFLNQLGGLMPGGSVAQLQGYLEGELRTLINGLDPVSATLGDIAAALGIPESLITDDVFSQLQDGINPEDLGFPIPDVNLLAGIPDVPELDPTELLQGFAEDEGLI